MQGRLIQPYLGPKGVVSIATATAAANNPVTLSIPGAGVAGNDVVIHWIAWSYSAAPTEVGRLLVTLDPGGVVFDIDLPVGKSFDFIPFPGRFPLFGDAGTEGGITLANGGAGIIPKLVACTS